MNNMDLEILIRNEVSDLVSSFLYYDRKWNEDLPIGVIDKAVKDNVISIDEIVEHFRLSLIDGLDK